MSVTSYVNQITTPVSHDLLNAWVQQEE